MTDWGEFGRRGAFLSIDADVLAGRAGGFGEGGSHMRQVAMANPRWSWP